MPIVADLLRAELGDRLGKPAGSEDREVEFVIDQGQTIDEIEENLVDAGLLDRHAGLPATSSSPTASTSSSRRAPTR